MGYATYVGRVGALAVALGIGAAVATTPGVAWADETDSGAPPPASEPAQNPETPNTSATSPEPLDLGGAIERRIERVADHLRRAVTGVVTSSGGAITSTYRNGSGTQRGNLVPESLKGQDALENPQPPKDPQPPNDEPVQRVSKSGQQPAAPDPKATVAAATGVVARVHQAVEDATAALHSTDAHRVTGALTQTATTLQDQGAAQARYTAATVESAQQITATPPAGPVVQIVSGLLAAIGLNPAAANSPVAPLSPQTLLGVLALIRREIEHTFFNQAPNLQDTPISLTVDEGGSVDINTLPEFDGDGDRITYSVAAPDQPGGPANGTVSIVGDTITYTPDDGYTGPDSFVVTASDAGSGFHLHGFDSIFNPQGAHTDTVGVTVDVEPDEDDGPPVFSDGTVENVKVGDVRQENEDEAEALDNQPFTTPSGATGIYHYHPATGTSLAFLSADVNPSDANRIAEFLNPFQPSTFSASSSMRMASFAAAVAPTYNGVEEFDVVVGTQTFHVVVPIAAARLQAGTPITVGEGPVAMAASGDHLYVVNLNSVEDPNTSEQKYYVSVIDTTTNLKVTDIEVGNNPTGITASGDRVYVVNSDQTITVIDAITNNLADADPSTPGVVDPIVLNRPALPTPFNIVASDDGTRLYVANVDGTISVINTTTNTEVDTQPPTTADPNDPEADIDPLTVTAGSFPYAMAVSGKRLYVTDPFNNSVTVINIDETDIDDPIVVEPDSNYFGQQIGISIPVGGLPTSIAAATPPGATSDAIYVSNQQDSTISVIDTSTNLVVATIQLTSVPGNVVFSPDGSLAYVSGQDQMTVIDTANRKVVLTTATDTTPDGFPDYVGLSADGSRVYAADYLQSTSGPEFGNTLQPISFVTGGNTAAPFASADVAGQTTDHGSGAVTTILTATDADNDALSISVTQPANGTATVTPTATPGSYRVTYTPNGQARLDAFDGTLTDPDNVIVTVTDGDEVTYVTVPVTIDPAQVAVTDTLAIGPGFHFARGLAASPNGDVYVTYLTPDSLTNPQNWKLSLWNAATQSPVVDEVYSTGPSGVNQFGEDVAVDNNGLTYVANPVTGKVDVYNGGGTPVPVDVGGTPIGLFTDSTGNVYALVTNPDSADPNQATVSVYRVTSPGGAVGEAYTATNGSGFNELSKGAVDGAGRVYVTNPDGTTVSVIDPANPAASPIEVGGKPISIAYNSTTQRVYATVSRPDDANNPSAYTVSVVDITSGTAVPVGDAYTVQPPQPNATGEQYTWLSDMAVSPDGSHIYVTNVTDSTVTVLNANTGAVDHTIAIPKDQFGQGAPFKIAFSPNGDHVYVLDQRGSVSVISFADTATNL